jgi:hypothetical protein
MCLKICFEEMHDSRLGYLDYLENSIKTKNFDVLDYEDIQDLIDNLRSSTDQEYEIEIDGYREKFNYLLYDFE